MGAPPIEGRKSMRFLRSRGLTSSLAAVLLACFMLVGCGDDDDGSPKPKVITLADLEGTWVATKYEVTSKDAPAMSLDLVTIGGAFSWDADGEGNFTGEVVIPEALGGPQTLPFAGNFELISQDSLAVNFNPEIPPLLTSSRVGFTLVGNTATITDDNGTFDFDMDGTEEPATFEGILVRNQ